MIFEMIFVLFTASIAIYSLRIYKLSEQRESRNFGLAFAFLSISYFLLIVINSLFLSVTSGNMRTMDLDEIMGLRNFAVFSHFLFLTLGFITLFYTTLKAKHERVYAILLTLCIAAIYFSCNRALIIYLVSSIFLAFISYHYLKEYRDNKNGRTLLVGLGMLLIFISNILMGFVGNYSLSNLYVLSRVLEIIAYSLIFTSLIKVFKNGKKKK
jgi:hypothetical protein